MGRAGIGTVGHARSELIDGRDLVEFAVAWMAAHLTAYARDVSK
jgi:aminoglycoside N3'-acetyltransferase